MAQHFAQCKPSRHHTVHVDWHVQVQMERLEIESAASDASSKILAAWPPETREHALTAALPASSSGVKPYSSSSRPALAAMDSRGLQQAAQQSSNMGKERCLEALIQPGMLAHIQVHCFASTVQGIQCCCDCPQTLPL
jgi:hypothetical protein